MLYDMSTLVRGLLPTGQAYLTALGDVDYFQGEVAAGVGQPGHGPPRSRPEPEWYDMTAVAQQQCCSAAVLQYYRCATAVIR